MALVECPDCGQQVSDQAAACNQCGRPMSTESTGPERQQRVTTQATGRQIKAHQLIGAVVTIVGIVMAIAGNSESGVAGFGGLLILVGLIWFIAARFMGWWRYG